MEPRHKKRKLAQLKLSSDLIFADIFSFMTRYGLEMGYRPICRRFAAIIGGERLSSSDGDESSPPPYHVLSSLFISDFCYRGFYLCNRYITYQDYINRLGTDMQRRLPNYVRIPEVGPSIFPIFLTLATFVHCWGQFWRIVHFHSTIPSGMEATCTE